MAPLKSQDSYTDLSVRPSHDSIQRQGRDSFPLWNSPRGLLKIPLLSNWLSPCMAVTHCQRNGTKLTALDHCPTGVGRAQCLSAGMPQHCRALNIPSF